MYLNKVNVLYDGPIYYAPYTPLTIIVLPRGLRKMIKLFKRVLTVFKCDHSWQYAHTSSLIDSNTKDYPYMNIHDRNFYSYYFCMKCWIWKDFKVISGLFHKLFLTDITHNYTIKYNVENN